MRWAKIYQRFWCRQVETDTAAPLYMRVGFVALSRHGANGHCELARGELAELLGKVDMSTGEVLPCQNISRAIRTAKARKWIDERSTARCLIVPFPDVQLNFGNPHAPCSIHTNSKGFIPLKR